MTANNQQAKQPKIKKLRYNEYYDIQGIMDDLYNKSKKQIPFKNLMEIILDERNIALAYRSIKSNKGSKTKGVNNTTIKDIRNKEIPEVVGYVRNRLQNFTPQKVRRVEIPKDDGSGKKRPLGIPTMEDRLIQQCILQILDPICEAKFHNHSYGFRANRSTHHALGRMYRLINRSKLHYCVDIDIKGFFDNVDHSKLLKQMWSLGIRDKHLLSVISRMLKAEVKGIGIQTKGTPQGGILSPLLSNIVLNELDWWVSNQWETFETNHQYAGLHKYRAMKNTKLKEMYIIRYADDFKILCRNHTEAQRIFDAIKQWLNERLHLEISDSKSKITNLKKNYTNFLGVKIKTRNKRKERVVVSHISDKAKIKCQNKLKKCMKSIRYNQNQSEVNKLNSTILGMHNYYKCATHCNIDFREIAYHANKNYFTTLKRIQTEKGNPSSTYKKLYGKYNYKIRYICGISIFPIAGVKMKVLTGFSQDICNYTEKGRQKIHALLHNINPLTLKYLVNNPVQGKSIEYNDNRISLYCGQNGKCGITGKPLLIGEMECHHKKMFTESKDDSYKNLIWLQKSIHKLIHLVDSEKIMEIVKEFEFDDKQLKKINKLRTLVGNSVI